MGALNDSRGRCSGLLSPASEGLLLTGKHDAVWSIAVIVCSAKLATRAGSCRAFVVNIAHD